MLLSRAVVDGRSQHCSEVDPWAGCRRRQLPRPRQRMRMMPVMMTTLMTMMMTWMRRLRARLMLSRRRKTMMTCMPNCR